MDEVMDADIKALFEKAEREAERISKPLGELAWAILNAGIHCRDSIKSAIRVGDDCKPLEQEAYILYEYLYLFIDLAMRDAVGALPAELLSTTQIYITRFISKVAVGMYFDHWAPEAKERIAVQFVEKLNERAEEFAHILRETHNELEVLDIFVLVAHEVTVLAKQDDQWKFMKEPMLATMTSEWMKAGFTNHFADVYAAHAAEEGV